MSKKTVRGIAFLSLFAFLLVGCPTGLKLLKILFPSISIEDKTKELVQKYLGDRFSLGNVLTNGVTLPVNIPGVGNLEWSFEGGGVTVDTNGAVTVDSGASDGTVTGTVSFTVLGEKITLPIPFDLKQTPSGIDAYKLALSSIQNTIDEKVLSSSTIDLLTEYSGVGTSSEEKLTIAYTIGDIKELKYDNNGKLKMARDIQDKRIEVPVTLSGIEVEAPSTQRAAGPTMVSSLDYTIPLLIPRIDVISGDDNIEFADGAIYVKATGSNNSGIPAGTPLANIGVKNYGSTTVSFSDDTPGTTDSYTLSGSFTASMQKATLRMDTNYLVTKREAYDKMENEAKQFVEKVVSNEKDLPRLYTEFKVKNGDIAALRQTLLTERMNSYIELLNIHYFEDKNFEYSIENGRLSISIPYDSKRTWVENLSESNGRAINKTNGFSLSTYFELERRVRYAKLVLNQKIDLIGTIQGNTITFGEPDNPTNGPAYSGTVTVTDNKDGTFAIRGLLEPAKSDSPSASGGPTEPIEINETLRFEGEDGVTYLSTAAYIRTW